ncbi:MAG: hypothetical protein LBF16_09000 [Pseudomonadales bacterium]|jgi:hypothetical protein|nr:hypothetical protein [Pseudomonadales bacterium]
MPITVSQRNDLVGLAVTMFKAAPGIDALNDVVSAYEGGASLANLATYLTTLPEFRQVYPTSLTAQEFANRLADYLLPASVAVPAADRAWAVNWAVDLLNAGQSRASVLLLAQQELRAATNPSFTAAKNLMTNRIAVATYYSVDKEQPTTSLDALQSVLNNVTADAASVQAAKNQIDQNLFGVTYNLTTGADTLTGTSGNDVFIAADTGNTFSTFDKLDGGKGNDTFNIYSNGTNNVGFPANATVTNIETINIYNSGSGTGFGAVDASKFVGATSINQFSIGNAITNLGVGTTAGFDGTAASKTLSVTAAAAAASATVALTNVGSSTTLNVAGAALNNVTISGNAGSSFKAGITVGKDVQSLALNTAITTALTIAETSTSTKHLTTLDASASKGAITLADTTTLTSITTGSGSDNITLKTAFSSSVKSATVNAGGGNNVISIATTGTGGKVTIDTGTGSDTVTIAKDNTAALNIHTGAGNDTVKMTSLADIAATDVIDGGTGTDTVQISSTSASTLVAGDYIKLNEVLLNFEAIKFSGSTTFDASRMASYKTITVAGGTATKVAADQKLFTSANLSAEATNTTTGTLDITATATSKVTAKAATVNLTAAAASNSNQAANLVATVTLEGDAKTANVNLTAATDGSAQDYAKVVLTTSASNMTNLTTATFTGTGQVEVVNSNATALATIDATGLTGTNAGITVHDSNVGVATAIKLSGGKDSVTIDAGISTYKSFDTIYNLTLNSNAALSDQISVGAKGFTKITVTGNTLNQALIQAANDSHDNVVFAYGGDTYIYADLGTAGRGAGNHVVDDTDLLVKLVGAVNLDLLVTALG